VFGALLYLRLTSFKNWTLVRGRRLRQPKYFLSAVVGIAYFYFFFFRPLGSSARAQPDAAGAAQQALDAAGVMLPADWLPLATAIGSLGLVFLLLCIWLVPTERAALGFSQAEIAFLFPAPITRRNLVHFRLLSLQFRSLFGASLMMFFSNRWTFLGGNAFTHAIGWWFVFSLLNLHLNGARFVLTTLGDRGVRVWRRRLAVMAVAIGLVAWTLQRQPLPQTGATDLDRLGTWVVAVAQTAPLSWLAWPASIVVAPFLAPDTKVFLLSLAPALAAIGLHYLWVVRSAVTFEDASVASADRRAARLAAWRAGSRRIHSTTTRPRTPPFPLAATGRPEIAFLWKNLLSTWPYFTWQVFAGCALAICAGVLWLRFQPGWEPFGLMVGGVALAFAGYTSIVGPQFARQDLRSDLTHADILKTYPLAGWQVILGQLLTPTLILTALLWLAVLAATLALPGGEGGRLPLTPSLRVAAGIGLAALAPLLAALQLLVPNAAALYFPGWFSTSRTRGGGPEIIGQRMIFFFAQLLTTLLALTPALALGAALFAVVQWIAGPVLAVGAAVALMLAILLAEIAGGLWLLGRRFEQLDLSAELRG
jgi:hypothetical protein